LADGRVVCADRTTSAERHTRQGTCGGPSGAQRHCPCAQVRRPLNGRTARGLRVEEDALQPLRALGGQGGLGRAVRDPGLGWRAAVPGTNRLHRREILPLRRRGYTGEQSQAIGHSRGGRTTKIHALTERACRPLAFLLTGGQVADGKAGALLLERLPTCRVVLADKGYDSDATRRQIEAAGAAPNT
jgi:hypothetical protein